VVSLEVLLVESLWLPVLPLTLVLTLLVETSSIDRLPPAPSEVIAVTESGTAGAALLLVYDPLLPE
jgi:hypothetical protein